MLPWNPVIEYMATRPNFFRTPHCINTNTFSFCACEGANLIKGVSTMLHCKALSRYHCVNLTESIPFPLVKTRGDYVFSSLSHNGVFASMGYNKEDNVYLIREGGIPKFTRRFQLNMTNLLTEETVDVAVEHQTIVGFFDKNCLLLTYGEYIREAAVADLFVNPRVNITKARGNQMEMEPWCDVSLLHSTRELYMLSTLEIPFSYNVDTSELTQLNLPHPSALWATGRIAHFTSTMGIDVGLPFVAQGAKLFSPRTPSDGGDKDGGVGLYGEYTNCGFLSLLIPSSSNPRDLTLSAKLCEDKKLSVDGVSWYELTDILAYDGAFSLVRVLEDIFITYNSVLRSWRLIRINVD